MLGNDQTEALARALHDTLYKYYLRLQDYVLIYPGHGAGSACEVHRSRGDRAARGADVDRAREIEGLGPVGARFVAEVIIGLLELDPRSFLGSSRNWSPLDGDDKIGADGVTTLHQILTT